MLAQEVLVPTIVEDVNIRLIFDGNASLFGDPIYEVRYSGVDNWVFQGATLICARADDPEMDKIVSLSKSQRIATVTLGIIIQINLCMSSLYVKALHHKSYGTYVAGTLAIGSTSAVHEVSDNLTMKRLAIFQADHRQIDEMQNRV